MGVDPGLVATGFGVLEAGAGAVTVRDAGVISTTTGQPLEARLNALHRAVHRIIEEQAPGLLVVEDLYTEYRFPRTAILMGHARGVIYLAARQLGVAVVAVAPSEVKRAMTGNGAAGKAQVQRAVQTVLGLREPPRPSHVADALGLAATGMSRITGRLPGRVAVGLVGATGGGLSAGSLSSSAGARKWPPHSPIGGQPEKWPPHSPIGGQAGKRPPRSPIGGQAEKRPPRSPIGGQAEKRPAHSPHGGQPEAGGQSARRVPVPGGRPGANPRSGARS